MATSSPIVRITRQTFSVYCLIHPHFRTSLLTHTHTHTRIGCGFPDLADDHRLISAAWAVAAHEPWCAVHYLFTANSYSGPWDSGLQLSASELFGQAGYVLDCATQPPHSIEIFNAHKAPLYNKHLINNLNRIISIFVWRLEFKLICKSSFKWSDQLTNKKYTQLVSRVMLIQQM